MSNNDRILKKVMKCLELSKSDNEHEAAAALRQAQALMKKHNLSLGDVEASKLEVHQVGGDYRRPPKWKTMLHYSVAEAFQCSCFHRGGNPVFVGLSPAPKVAAYAVEVLERQLLQNKKQYMTNLKSKHTLDRSTSVKVGKGFAEGWVIGCAEKVEEFATPLTEREEASHKSRIVSHFGVTIKPWGKRKSALDDAAGRFGSWAGYEHGQQAQIHAGMSTDGGPELLGRGTA